jgi:hypothetical protein
MLGFERDRFLLRLGVDFGGLWPRFFSVSSGLENVGLARRLVWPAIAVHESFV